MPATTCSARHFRAARPHQLCAEASTNYTKLPTFPGCAARARELLGPGLKLIYIVREPVARAVSHHHHSYINGKLPRRFDAALDQTSILIDYSRYAMQLEPWLDAFGREAIHIMRFDDFVADRRSAVSDVARFLGLDPAGFSIDDGRVYNRSAGRPTVRGGWKLITGNPVYRRLIWPLLPADVLERLRHMLLPRVEAEPVAPSPAAIDRLVEAFEPDVEHLSRLMGRDTPVWDMAAVRRAWQERMQGEPGPGV
ncbi:MAG: sulfotransferase domain-containing protein [Phycisphaeraceae bacterium]